MASIDFSRILDKAKKYTETGKFKKEKDKIVTGALLGKITLGAGSNLRDNIENASSAADKFIVVLRNEIGNHIGSDYSKGQFSELARDVLDDITHSAPYSDGDKVYVDIMFTDDRHRDSLDPSYEGIDNIIALLNNGYNANGAVFGDWIDHNNVEHEDTWSVRRRGGAHFIEQAVTDFWGNYATDYNVIDIKVAEEYGVRT